MHIQRCECVCDVSMREAVAGGPGFMMPHTHTCIHTDIHAYTHMHAYLHAYIHTFNSTYTHAYVRTYKYTHTHTPPLARTCATLTLPWPRLHDVVVVRTGGQRPLGRGREEVYMHTCLHTYVHSYVRGYIHTHPPTLLRVVVVVSTGGQGPLGRGRETYACHRTQVLGHPALLDR
jgi:hypothetical protein